MIRNYKVITLCGSTKFKEEFNKIEKELTLQGNIVLSLFVFGHSGDDEVWVGDTKQSLDDMHLARIDLCDEIFVINKNGYIGESTTREIKYAHKAGKEIKSLEPLEGINNEY